MTHRKNRKKPWELKEELRKPKGFFSLLWQKIKGCFIWIAAACAAIIDFIINLF